VLEQVMNERWKNLIQQAINEIGPEDNPSKEETLKRYAELIIKECANVAADHEALDIYEEILDHWGM
jgi:hypothetical protein